MFPNGCPVFPPCHKSPRHNVNHFFVLLEPRANSKEGISSLFGILHRHYMIVIIRKEGRAHQPTSRQATPSWLREPQGVTNIEQNFCSNMFAPLLSYFAHEILVSSIIAEQSKPMFCMHHVWESIILGFPNHSIQINQECLVISRQKKLDNLFVPICLITVQIYSWGGFFALEILLRLVLRSVSFAIEFIY